MMEMKLHGMEGVLDALRALPAEVVSKGGGPVKRALRKGALPILSQVQANLRQKLAEHRAGGDETTGLLLKAVRVTRGKPPLDQKGERYLVRFSRSRYPDRKGKPVTTLKTAQIYEYGAEHQPARPFIRPAYLARGEEALQTIQRELLADIERIARRLAKPRRL